MMLVNLPVTAWARAILLRMHATVAGISAYVDDKVIRSRSFKHLQLLLERTVKFDRFTGQCLNFDKSMRLCTVREDGKKLRTLTVEGTPLLIANTCQIFGSTGLLSHIA